MKIVVTGAAGFIGSHTCEALVGRGHEVVGVDCFDGFLYPAAPKRENAHHLRATLDPHRFEFREADILDRDAMDSLVSDGVDLVCHLAALAGVRPSLAEPVRYARVNVQGTVTIAEACHAAGVRRLVFASSASVYGARAGGVRDLSQVTAFREDDPCLTPASPYAATKRAGELLLSTYRDLYGIGVTSLRYFTVYGPRQRPDMAIGRFARALAAGAPITLFGDGRSRRDYTFVGDIAAGTVAACERTRPGDYRIYNLGTGVTTSLAELVAAVERVLGRRADIERSGDQPGDVPVTFADISAARRDLDYAPKTPLEDGIRAFWSWFQSR